MDLHHRYVAGGELVKNIPLATLKMVARQEKSLVVAFLNEKNKLDELSLHFYSAKLAEEWELLLRDKKAEAKLQQKMSEDKATLIANLIESVKGL